MFVARWGLVVARLLVDWGEPATFEPRADPPPRPAGADITVRTYSQRIPTNYQPESVSYYRSVVCCYVGYWLLVLRNF